MLFFVCAVNSYGRHSIDDITTKAGCAGSAALTTAGTAAVFCCELCVQYKNSKEFVTKGICLKALNGDDQTCIQATGCEQYGAGALGNAYNNDVCYCCKEAQ